MPVGRPLVLLRPELPGDCWALRLDEPGTPFQIQPASPDSSSLLVAASLRVSGDGAIAGSLRVTAGGTASPYFELHAANRGGDGILDAPVAQMDLGIESGSVRVVRLGPSGVVVEGRVEGSRAADGEGTIRAVQLPFSPPGGLDRLHPRIARPAARAERADPPPGPHRDRPARRTPRLGPPVGGRGPPRDGLGRPARRGRGEPRRDHPRDMGPAPCRRARGLPRVPPDPRGLGAPRPRGCDRRAVRRTGA